MERGWLSSQEHEFEYLAKKHGTTVGRVREIVRRSGARSRSEIEEAIQFPHLLPDLYVRPAE